MMRGRERESRNQIESILAPPPEPVKPPFPVNHGWYGWSDPGDKSRAYYLNWKAVGDSWCPRPPDPEPPMCFVDMAKLYLEAARRLPIADMPDLARCLCSGGLCIGLADPVTNIILSALYLFAHPQEQPAPLTKKKFLDLNFHSLSPLNFCTFLPAVPQPAPPLTEKSFVDVARRSHDGLVLFMQCYFRYLCKEQATRCIEAAGHDLVLAIRLVEHQRGIQLADVVPDAGKTMMALEFAAREAKYPVPGQLVRFLSSRFPHDKLDPILGDLRGGKELGAQCVRDIIDLMHRVEEFRPISSRSWVPLSYTDNGLSYLELEATAATLGVRCESLKPSLLDTIHGMYIEALAMLPCAALRERHLLRAVVAGGHCYGPMDPVSNIILNSIWYHSLVVSSLSQVELAADILDTRSMSRAVSRSLDGIIALLRATYAGMSANEAVVCLCHNRSNLSHLMQQSSSHSSWAAAAKAAKHPQPAALASFLSSLSPDKLDLLRSVLRAPKDPAGHVVVLSGDALEQLNMTILSKEPAPAAQMQMHAGHQLCQPAALEKLSTERLAFTYYQRYVREKLEALLLDYAGKNPSEPAYKLGVICGVAQAYRHYCFFLQRYHVNFLATTTSAPACNKLFFAEFLYETGGFYARTTTSKQPLCCPIQDFHADIGRCFNCEIALSRIVHPPCGKHEMGVNADHKRSLFQFLCVNIEEKPDLDEMLDLDFIYFDGERDYELAESLNSSCSVPKQ